MGHRSSDLHDYIIIIGVIQIIIPNTVLIKYINLT